MLAKLLQGIYENQSLLWIVVLITLILSMILNNAKANLEESLNKKLKQLASEDLHDLPEEEKQLKLELKKVFAKRIEKIKAKEANAQIDSKKNQLSTRIILVLVNIVLLLQIYLLVFEPSKLFTNIPSTQAAALFAFLALVLVSCVRALLSYISYFEVMLEVGKVKWENNKFIMWLYKFALIEMPVVVILASLQALMRYWK